MPISTEQWRAAIGVWNWRIRPPLRTQFFLQEFAVERTKNETMPEIMLCFLWMFLMMYLFIIGSLISSKTNEVSLTGLPQGKHMIQTLSTFHWDHISIVTRTLLILSGDIELNPGPISMDLKMLLNLLHDVRAKWYPIGIQLGISTGTLDAIKATNTDCAYCLQEMLKFWLARRSHSEKIDVLLEALASEAVGETALAERTRHLHLTVDNQRRGRNLKSAINATKRVCKNYEELKKCMIEASWTGRILGKGSFGTVLEMKSAHSDKLYAGKKYHQIPPLKSRFIMQLNCELLILKELNHPNIVQTLGVTFDSEECPIVLMECMGSTFQQYIQEVPHTSLILKAKWLCDVASGLNYLHQQRPIIIHRDLTATNVLLDLSLEVAKISDFGNARMLNLTANCTPISSQSGTLPYMPPEAMEQDSHDSSFDVFSFGHLMLFTITGEIPTLLGATYVDEYGVVVGRSEFDRRKRHVIKAHKQLGENHIINQMLRRCLHNLAQKRPSAEDLVHTLKHVMSHDDSESDIHHLLLQPNLPERQLKVTSTRRTTAPQLIDRGAACTSQDGVAYFTAYKSPIVYKFEPWNYKWTKLHHCPHMNFGLAVIRGLLTAVGGEYVKAGKSTHTEALTSLKGLEWVNEFLPMKTPRSRPAVVTSNNEESLVVAGGLNHEGDWWSDAVEHYNTTSQQWTSLAPIPIRLPGISAALCNDQLYLLDWSDSAYTASLSTLLTHSKSPQSSSESIAQSLWRALPAVPCLWSTPASICGKLVVVGGHTRPYPTNAVHLYDDEGKWTCIGRMSYSRRDSIVTVLNDDMIMVVGGLDPHTTDDVEILSIS